MAIVYISAAGFLISVFPIHIFNYIYIDTEEGYASVNVTIFRFIKALNVNTVKNQPNAMQINGKNKTLSLDMLNFDFYKIFNQMCIQKVIQLSDFGVKKQSNVYAALAQHAATTVAYNFLKINGNTVKLRNYAILNQEHSSIRYYAKAVTIINLLVAAKILIKYCMEKINELKNQKK